MSAENNIRGRRDQYAVRDQTKLCIAQPEVAHMSTVARRIDSGPRGTHLKLDAVVPLNVGDGPHDLQGFGTSG